MKDKTEASSTAEVIKEALRLYEFVINEHDKGNVFCLRSKDGTAEEIRIFL